MIDEKIRNAIRDVPDFPKPGIIFKDITPILKDPTLCNEVLDAFIKQLNGWHIDAIAGIESRGFLFGLMLANRLSVPFIPIRKKGKLPYETLSKSYALEYGTATIEMHIDAVSAGSNVLLHDDLLATGGTILAASELIQAAGGHVAGYSFVINLAFLNAGKKLEKFSKNLITLIDY